MIPILYSFRRCPYAMRARLAIAYSQQTIQLREIILKQKPQEMLALSKKGTVPILQLSNGDILDESLDIMAWALSEHDPQQWINADLHKMLSLIDQNDFEFKTWLDKYKYADRFPEQEPVYYRQQCEDFLVQLELRLSQHNYLFSDAISLADMAIFPFIRQFASVDKPWFQQSLYPRLQAWLNRLTDTPLFHSVMKSYPTFVTANQSYPFP